MSFKILGLFIGVVLVCLIPAMTNGSPQQPTISPTQATTAEGLPSAEAILERYVQALGGREACMKLTSRVSKGTTEAVDEASGGVEIYEKAPNKYYWAADYEGYGVVRQGFDGTTGWTENPDNGISDIPSNRIARLARGVDFYREIKLKELYPRLAVTGRQQVDGREAYIIEAAIEDGAKESWCFDVETGLLLKASVQRPTAQGNILIETILGDYREVDGVKLPFLQRRKDPQRTVITKLTDVRHNVDIDDAKFKKPVKP